MPDSTTLRDEVERVRDRVKRLEAALRAAPMPYRESTHGEDWEAAYDEWWHGNASEAALAPNGQEDR